MRFVLFIRSGSRRRRPLAVLERSPRRRKFTSSLGETGWFLGKWLTLAFAIESLMVAYIPASMVAEWLGGDAWWTIPAAVAAGIPAYMNGFAAIPLMAGLIEMGMAKERRCHSWSPVG